MQYLTSLKNVTLKNLKHLTSNICITFLFIKLHIWNSVRSSLSACYFGISLDNFHAYSTVSLGSKASKWTGAIFLTVLMSNIRREATTNDNIFVGPINSRTVTFDIDLKICAEKWQEPFLKSK